MTRILTTAGALALAAALAACAANPPPPEAYSPAPPANYFTPPPGGFSGSSTLPAAQARGGYGYGSSEPEAPRHFVTNRQTPMRVGPRNSFDARAELPAGTPVNPDGYVSGDWWQIDSKFGFGWVYSRNLSVS